MPASDGNVTAKQLGYLLNGLTPRRVQQLASDGIIKKEARGRYNLVESVRSYLQYKDDVYAGKEGEPTTDYGDARTQKMRADADKAIMETAQLAGNLIPSDVVAYHWNYMLGAFRSKLLNLPKKTAPLVQHESTLRKCNSALQTAVHECLAELSKFKPPDKHFRNLEQFLAGPAAGPNNKRMGRPRKTTKLRKQRRAG